MSHELLRLDRVTRLYTTGNVETSAVENVSLSVAHGEYLAVTGQSGSGKSTLLSIMGLVDRPTAGEYWFDGEATHDASEARRAAIRAADIGVVFQAFHLIPELSVRENVELRLKYHGVRSAAERKQRALEAIDRVELSHRADHYPDQLSGGQQQRVAIARAVVGKPKLILADEPTGNLDSNTGEQIMALFRAISESGTAIVLVTHAAHFAEHASRIVVLSDGCVMERGQRSCGESLETP